MNRMGRGFAVGGGQWENGMGQVGGASGRLLGGERDEPDGAGFGGERGPMGERDGARVGVASGMLMDERGWNGMNRMGRGLAVGGSQWENGMGPGWAGLLIG